jgi:hypothetical protein
MKLGIGACNPKGVRTQILRLPGDAKKMNQATEGAMPFYSHSPFELVVFFKSLQKLDPETKTKVLYLWLHIQSAYMSLPLPFLKSEKDYVSMSWWLGYPVEIDIQIPPKGKNLWICITKEPYQWCSGVAQTHFPDWTRPWFEKLQTFVLSRTNEPT